MGSSDMDKTPKEESKTPPATSQVYLGFFCFLYIDCLVPYVMPEIFCCLLQEQSSTTGMPTTNPDWSNFQVFNEKVLVSILCFCCTAWILILNSFIVQTYSPIPPHGFLASSPQAHPYMWGVQVSYIHNDLSNFLCCYHFRCFCYCQYVNCYTLAIVNILTVILQL